MTPDTIFFPAVALVVLTLLVMVRLYVVRLTEMHTRGIEPQDIATGAAATALLRDTAAADNFRSLFEVPVLFYAICPLLYATHRTTQLQLALAWAFVIGRCVHSLIHLSYNRVMHRFTAFIVSTLCVFAMWFLFALRLWDA